MLIIQVYVNYSSICYLFKFRRSSICWMGDAGRTVYRRTVDVLMPVFFSPITTNYSANELQPPLVLKPILTFPKGRDKLLCFVKDFR